MEVRMKILKKREDRRIEVTQAIQGKEQSLAQLLRVLYLLSNNSMT